MFQSGGRGKEQKEKLDRVAFCPEAQNQPFWQRRSYIYIYVYRELRLSPSTVGFLPLNNSDTLGYDSPESSAQDQLFYVADCPTQAVGVPGVDSPQRPEQRTRDGVAASFGV